MDAVEALESPGLPRKALVRVFHKSSQCPDRPNSRLLGPSPDSRWWGKGGHSLGVIWGTLGRLAADFVAGGGSVLELGSWVTDRLMCPCNRCSLIGCRVLCHEGRPLCGNVTA